MSTSDRATAAPPAFLRLAAHPVRWRLMAELAESDLRVRELADRVGEPQNLVSYHLRALRDGGLITSRRSSHDGRDSYYRLDLSRCAAALADSGAALHPALARGGAPAGRGSRHVAVLFVCTGNSARSPIAQAALRNHAPEHVAAASAGIRPRPSLHPQAIQVLRERFGIDISDQRPQRLDVHAGHGFTHVITLCDSAREACLVFPDHPWRAHWSMPDPAAAGGSEEAAYAAFGRTTAEIDTRVRQLLPVLATDSSEVRP
ncbi:MAG: metalloregulator ArsR/SmtB family transcription factor [Pseudonocardia sp.]|nr:metalloregulator ArsR/SmtB family transcription factor [Pseudonocardia sp.]